MWNCPGPVPRLAPGLEPLAVLIDLGDARIDVAVADKSVAGLVPGDVGHLSEKAIVGRKRRVRMFEWRGVLVRGFLFAPEHHVDPAFRGELDHHIRALVGDPDIVLGVDLHRVRERPGIEVMADLPQIIAVGVKLEQLRRRRGVSRAGRIASMQHEDVALRIDRDAGNFAQVEVGRQVQKIRDKFIRDGRDFLSGGEISGREADRDGAGHGKKLATSPRRMRACVTAGTGLQVSVAHRVLSRRRRRADALFAVLNSRSDGRSIEGRWPTRSGR